MLQEDLNADMKQAMKDKDKVKLSTIRMIKASLKNAEIKAGHPLTDEEELQVLATEMKQRKESRLEFEKGKRDDLVKQIDEEIAVVEKYLPAQLDESEVEDIVTTTISEVGATGKADFGKVMQALMPKVKGRADGAMVNQIVKEKLG